METTKLVNRTFTLELYEENGKQYIHISTDGASGCKYQVTNNIQIGELVADYIYDYYTEE